MNLIMILKWLQNLILTSKIFSACLRCIYPQSSALTNMVSWPIVAYKRRPSFPASSYRMQVTTKRPLQLISFDMVKAFARGGHHILVFLFMPEIIMIALQHYTLLGFACVEVNRKSGILITINTQEVVREINYLLWCSLPCYHGTP
jgi:hypothetical protein